MKLEEILEKCKKGDKIRRKKWTKDRYIPFLREGSFFDDAGGYYILPYEALRADDWEFYEEPVEKCEACKLEAGRLLEGRYDCKWGGKAFKFLLKEACKCGGSHE